MKKYNMLIEKCKNALKHVGEAEKELLRLSREFENSVKELNTCLRMLIEKEK